MVFLDCVCILIQSFLECCPAAAPPLQCCCSCFPLPLLMLFMFLPSCCPATVSAAPSSFCSPFRPATALLLPCRNPVTTLLLSWRCCCPADGVGGGVVATASTSLAVPPMPVALHYLCLCHCWCLCCCLHFCHCCYHLHPLVHFCARLYLYDNSYSVSPMTFKFSDVVTMYKTLNWLTFRDHGSIFNVTRFIIFQN